MMFFPFRRKPRATRSMPDRQHGRRGFRLVVESLETRQLLDAGLEVSLGWVPENPTYIDVIRDERSVAQEVEFGQLSGAAGSGARLQDLAVTVGVSSVGTNPSDLRMSIVQVRNGVPGFTPVSAAGMAVLSGSQIGTDGSGTRDVTFHFANLDYPADQDYAFRVEAVPGTGSRSHFWQILAHRVDAVPHGSVFVAYPDGAQIDRGSDLAFKLTARLGTTKTDAADTPGMPEGSGHNVAPIPVEPVTVEYVSPGVKYRDLGIDGAVQFVSFVAPGAHGQKIDLRVLGFNVTYLLTAGDVTGELLDANADGTPSSNVLARGRTTVRTTGKHTVEIPPTTIESGQVYYLRFASEGAQLNLDGGEDIRVRSWQIKNSSPPRETFYPIEFSFTYVFSSPPAPTTAVGQVPNEGDGILAELSGNGSFWLSLTDKERDALSKTGVALRKLWGSLETFGCGASAVLVAETADHLAWIAEATRRLSQLSPDEVSRFFERLGKVLSTRIDCLIFGYQVKISIPFVGPAIVLGSHFEQATADGKVSAVEMTRLVGDLGRLSDDFPLGDRARKIARGVQLPVAFVDWISGLERLFSKPLEVDVSNLYRGELQEFLIRYELRQRGRDTAGPAFIGIGEEPVVVAARDLGGSLRVDQAQGFRLPHSSPVYGAEVYLLNIQQESYLEGSIEVRVETDREGIPGGLAHPEAWGIVNARDLRSGKWNSIFFPGAPVLDEGGYVLVILSHMGGQIINIASGIDPSDHYPEGTRAQRAGGSLPWAKRGDDVRFRVYRAPLPFRGVVKDVGGPEAKSLAQSFSVSEPTVIVGSSFYNLFHEGVAGSVRVRIETDAGGTPSGTLVHPAAVGSVDVQSLSPEDWNLVVLDAPVVLPPGVYHIVILGSPGIVNVPAAPEGVDHYSGGSYAIRRSRDGSWEPQDRSDLAVKLVGFPLGGSQMGLVGGVPGLDVLLVNRVDRVSWAYNGPGPAPAGAGQQDEDGSAFDAFIGWVVELGAGEEEEEDPPEDAHIEVRDHDGEVSR